MSATDDVPNTTEDDQEISVRTGGWLDFPAKNLQAHLICSLCGGYFREPYTVVDCLHTFCRVCLSMNLMKDTQECPTCHTRIGPDTSKEIVADRALEEIINKIFPELKKKEEEDERNFYARRGIGLKP